MTGALPWARPRHELLLLALVAVAALTPVYVVSTQDVTRLCLSRALVHGRVGIEPCAGDTFDRATYGGRVYSDKAPGMSVFSVPAVEAVRLPSPAHWAFLDDRRLWAVRALTGGLAFLLAAWAVGRVSEGLRPGLGGAALVAFALGTLAAPLAATTFDHVTAGTLAFAAFLLAWRRRFALAGFAAACAAFTNYTTATIAVVVGGYVLLRGLAPLARYAAGAVPPLLGLAAYDWAAFGSPFHLSYRYVSNSDAAEQAAGFFGIHAPSLHGLQLVLAGDRGLLVASPVLAAAAAGLFLLARRHLAEALVCALAFALLFVTDAGYFDPYGGLSPGPRFLVPALPFLALGLAPAFARWRAATSLLAAASLVAMTTLTLTWAETLDVHYRQTVWGELARLPAQGFHSRLAHLLTKNVLGAAGLTRVEGAALVAAAVAAAALTAAASAKRR